MKAVLGRSYGKGSALVRLKQRSVHESLFEVSQTTRQATQKDGRSLEFLLSLATPASLTGKDRDSRCNPKPNESRARHESPY
jgi:hypothetical protein